MKITSLFLIAIIFLSVNKALAADWLLMSQDTESEVYIDKSSIKRTGYIVDCWVKEMNHMSKIAPNKVSYDYSVFFYKYNLIDNTYKIFDTNYYQTDSGSHVYSYNANGYSKRVIPDTVGEEIIKYLSKATGYKLSIK